MRVASLGEILWDLIGGQENISAGEFLGGATFNFSVQLARLGHDVSFISAVGDDARGRRALETANELQLPANFISITTEAPTGTVSVTVDSHGQPSYVLHRPAAYDFAELPSQPIHPDWIYHGTLTFLEPRMRTRLLALIAQHPGARRFYDINLRKNSYTQELVMTLLPLADVVKMNEEEMAQVQTMTGTAHPSIEAFCRHCAARFQWEAVCVTRGERGCAILKGNEYVEVPGAPVIVADAVGAGDAFAAAFLHGIDAGWHAAKIGAFANRLGALVASRAGGVPDWSFGELGP